MPLHRQKSNPHASKRNSIRAIADGQDDENHRHGLHLHENLPPKHRLAVLKTQSIPALRSRRTWFPLWLVCCLAAFGSLAMGFEGQVIAASETAAKLEFKRDIRPILSESCFVCHGPDKNNRKAKLRLDVREIALEKEAIKPGKPDEPELVHRIFATNDDEIMPPPDSRKSLT